MNLIATITYGIWIISEIIISVFLRSKKTDKQGVDRGSISLIWIVVFISIFMAIFISEKYSVPILRNSNIKYFGILLIYIGIIFRLLTVKTLGRFFTADVTIRKDHQLKKDGFYKYLRHPSYSASLLSFIGFGFLLNNLISLAFVFISILTVFIVRIKIEEKALIKHFGSEYIAYKKATKGIIPFIY